MKVVAIKDMSTGNETVGEMWQETKIFDGSTVKNVEDFLRETTIQKVFSPKRMKNFFEWYTRKAAFLSVKSAFVYDFGETWRSRPRRSFSEDGLGGSRIKGLLASLCNC